MQVLVATGQEAANLIAINEEGDPFIAAKFSFHYHLRDWLLSLANEVEFFVSNGQRGHRQIPELNLLI